MRQVTALEVVETRRHEVVDFMLDSHSLRDILSELIYLGYPPKHFDECMDKLITYAAETIADRLNRE